MASVLVIDDNATNRKLVVAVLSHYGHLTFEARDGADALEVAAEAHPQLIISDILMPTMDGFEFLRRLRTVRELSRIPVIFYTAHYHELEAQQLALSAGAARVLLKPCPGDKLLQAVEQVLAGVSESDADMLVTHFDREHLLLVTNKLAEKANALSASQARFEALARLTLSVSVVSEPQEQMQKACDGARALLGSRFAVLVAGHGKYGGAEQRTLVTSGVDFAGALPVPPRADAGSLDEVLRGRSSLRLSGHDASTVGLGLPSGYPTASALLVVTLSSPTRDYGWLCLGDKIGAAEFTSEDEDVLTILAAQLAPLYESAIRRGEASQQLSRLQRLVSEMSAVIARTQTQEEIVPLLRELVSGMSRALDGRG